MDDHIPNQSSVAKAFNEFDEEGRMKPSAYYDRAVDVMEGLVKFTLLTRGRAEHLVDRYSGRKKTAEELSKRVNLAAVTDPTDIITASPLMLVVQAMLMM